MPNTDIPTTIRELRVQAATMAARAQHVFERVITTSSTPMSRADTELRLMAHAGSLHGFALAEVLRIVQEREPVLCEELIDAVVDIGMNGDDGRCADIWPDVEADLAEGGVGTDAWDAETRRAAVR